MFGKKNSKFEVVGEPLSDESLEEVAGGFGQTPHTVLLTSQNFNAWLGSSRNQVVLFGAGWVSSCNSANATLELLAAENPDYQVGIVNVDENEEFWMEYVTEIPTVIKYYNGYEYDKIVGDQSADNFRKLFVTNLSAI